MNIGDKAPEILGTNEKGEEIDYLKHRKQMCMNLDLFDKERII